jgi:hypothetical protein
MRPLRARVDPSAARVVRVRARASLPRVRTVRVSVSVDVRPMRAPSVLRVAPCGAVAAGWRPMPLRPLSRVRVVRRSRSTPS